MKRIILGCLVGILGLMGLRAASAQDAIPSVQPDSQILVEPTGELIPALDVSLTPESIHIVVSEMPPLSEVSPIPIQPSSQVFAATVEVIPLILTEVTSQDVTTEAVTLIEEVIILPLPDVSVPMSPSQVVMPPMTPTFTLRSVQGQALYPNRTLGQALIRLQSFAPDDTLLSTAYTDVNGLYSLVVSTNQVTRIEIDVSLHLSETLYLDPGDTPAQITLRAGDLNGDSCVTRADVELLISHYGESFIGADIDGSGLVDLIDLTLLSVNYDKTCVSSSPMDTPLVPISLTLTATEEVIVVTEAPIPAPSLPTEIFVTEEVGPLMSITATETATSSPSPDDKPLSIDATEEATSQS